VSVGMMPVDKLCPLVETNPDRRINGHAWCCLLEHISTDMHCEARSDMSTFDNSLAQPNKTRSRLAN